MPEAIFNSWNICTCDVCKEQQDRDWHRAREREREGMHFFAVDREQDRIDRVIEALTRRCRKFINRRLTRDRIRQLLEQAEVPDEEPDTLTIEIKMEIDADIARDIAGPPG